MNLFANLAAIVGWGTAIQVFKEAAEIELIIEAQLVCDFLHLEIGVDDKGQCFLIDPARDVFFRADPRAAGERKGKGIHRHSVGLCQGGDADVRSESAFDQIEYLGKLHVGGKVTGHDSIQLGNCEGDPGKEVAPESQQFRDAESIVRSRPLPPLGNVE